MDCCYLKISLIEAIYSDDIEDFETPRISNSWMRSRISRFLTNP